MKKVLALVLALVLMLGMSVTAFADTNLSDSGLGSSTSGSINVNAIFVPNTNIAATVEWGDMDFTFYEYSSTWVANNNSNIVTVTNNSVHQNIQATYSYTTEGVYLAYGVGLFEGNAASSFVLGSSTTDLKSLINNAQVTGYILGRESSNNKEINSLMFTVFPAQLEDKTESSVKIGTLTVSIAANSGDPTAPSTSSGGVNIDPEP